MADRADLASRRLALEEALEVGRAIFERVLAPPGVG
jgi:hypothetical protein